MTEHGDDFETFLKTRTLLPHGMSDDDKLEPPKALDTIVLKRAREAIHAREQPSRTPRWATPVALAATILLCLSIVLNVSLNTNRPTANLRRMDAATTSSAAPAAAPVPASPMSEGERRDKVADGSTYNEAILPEAKVVEPHASRPPVVAEQAAPAPRESLRRDDTASDKADALANGSGRRVPALKKAPSTADNAALLADRSGTPPTQAPSEAAAAASAPAAPPPAASAPPAGPPPAVVARSPSPPANEAALSPRTAALAARATPSRDGAPEAQGRDQPALAKPKPAAAPTHPKDPKVWLRQIADLRAEGKTAEADAEMQHFRATFPAYEAKPGPAEPSEPPK
jgi:hypothetical protein